MVYFSNNLSLWLTKISPNSWQKPVITRHIMGHSFFHVHACFDLKGIYHLLHHNYITTFCMWPLKIDFHFLHTIFSHLLFYIPKNLDWLYVSPLFSKHLTGKEVLHVFLCQNYSLFHQLNREPQHDNILLLGFTQIILVSNIKKYKMSIHFCDERCKYIGIFFLA